MQRAQCSWAAGGGQWHKLCVRAEGHLGSDLRPPAQRGQRPSLGHTADCQEKQEQNAVLLLSSLGLLPGHWVAHESAAEISWEPGRECEVALSRASPSFQG